MRKVSRTAEYGPWKGYFYDLSSVIPKALQVSSPSNQTSSKFRKKRILVIHGSSP